MNGYLDTVIEQVEKQLTGVETKTNEVLQKAKQISFLGPVASEAQYNTVSRYVQIANQEANPIVKGDLQVDPSSGYYLAPLVVDGVGQGHPLIQEEIFGPVMTLLSVENFDDALAACNNTVFGLSASVFTGDLNNGLLFLDEAQAGMGRINMETAGVEYQAPFGGMKLSSSHTREQGQAALDFYSQTKTCAVY